MNKELLDELKHKREAYKRWKGPVTQVEYTDTVLNT